MHRLDPTPELAPVVHRWARVMRILVTNDDGVFSPGLRELAEVSADFGDLLIVAPEGEQSSVAQAVTGSRPISYRPAKVGRFEAFGVDGTPADCVGLGIFVWGAVDLVLAGINIGLNLGNAVWRSGTLAAAKQASLLGVRGIAVSAPDRCEEEGYDTLRPHLKTVLRELLALTHLALVNVNLPMRPTGIRLTRQSVRHYAGQIERSHDPPGPRDLLVRAATARARRTGHRSLGHRERAHVEHTAPARPHGPRGTRGVARCGAFVQRGEVDPAA